MNKVKLCLLTAAITFLSLSYAYPAAGQNLPNGYRLNFDKKLSDKNPKISPKIEEVMGMMETISRATGTEVPVDAEQISTPLVRVDKSGEIQAYIFFDQMSDENLKELQDMEAEIEIVNGKHKIVQTWVPMNKVEQIAELGFVRKITPPNYGRVRAGSVTTEADQVLRSDDVRSTLGFDGTGITFGVISDGVDTLEDSQDSGDIPGNVIVGDPGEDDEGTAVLEVIHDIAPGARVAFHSGLTSLRFIEGIEFFIDRGADVIIDDLAFIREPFFEDGIIAREAQEAVDRGIVFVSAAGNDGNSHYQRLYLESDPEDGDPITNIHDFGMAHGGASDLTMRVVIPALRTFIFVLQWNDPFDGSLNDYDLFAFNPSNGMELESSTDIQDGNDDPLEDFTISNSTSESLPVDIVINRFSGEPRVLELYVFSNASPIFLEYNVEEDSVFGHPAAPGVIAVGAVPVSNPSVIEPFSSRGPSSIFFPSFPTASVAATSSFNPNDSSPRQNEPSQIRPKPDLVAPDGISTSVPGFDPFFGTSPAAPHVAGVVALILDKNPNLTPEELANVLANTAVDLGFGGFDNTFGFGRVDAFAAVQAVMPGTEDPGDNDSNGGSSSGGCTLAPPQDMNPKFRTAFSSLLLLLPFILAGIKAMRRQL